MAVSKVVYDGSTLIDLTGDSVTPGSLKKGVTAHDAAGNEITGTLANAEGVNLYRTLTANGWQNGRQTITIPSLEPDADGRISLSQSASKEQVEVAADAVLLIESQSENQLVIQATGIIPTVDLPVCITIFNGVTIQALGLAEWAQAEQKPSYTAEEVGAAPAGHTHSYSDLTGAPPAVEIPDSLPASDVHDWAKAENKPSYSISEIQNGTIAARTDLTTPMLANVIFSTAEPTSSNVAPAGTLWVKYKE